MAPVAEGEPERPDDLTGEAAKLWDFLLVELVGTAKRIDTPALYALCRTWELYRKALEFAEKHPTDKDFRIAVTAYLAAFNQIGARFGLTPADRARLCIEGPVSPESELEAFLAQDELDQVSG